MPMKHNTVVTVSFTPKLLARQAIITLTLRSTINRYMIWQRGVREGNLAGLIILNRIYLYDLE